MLSKRMFRRLGLSVVAMMGLAAFFAAGAQAVAAGEFKVLGSAALATGETFAGAGGLVVFLVAALNTEVHCEKFTITSGVILSGPEGKALAVFLFENCVIKSISPLETLTTCLISNGGPNHHIKMTAMILSVLHNGIRYLLVDEDGTIEFDKGVGCTLPNPVLITGTYAFETSQTEVLKPLVLAGNAALQTLLGDELKFGKNKEIIDQTAANDGTVELTGVHKGCTWGAV